MKFRDKPLQRIRGFIVGRTYRGSVLPYRNTYFKVLNPMYNNDNYNGGDLNLWCLVTKSDGILTEGTSYWVGDLYLDKTS
jgi:hypothetical protein